MAEQLRQPSGLVGRAFGAILNRANAPINHRVIDRLDVRPGQHVLDIGFGGGVGIARLLQQRVGLAAGPRNLRSDAAPRPPPLPARDRAGTVELTTASVAAIPYAESPSVTRRPIAELARRSPRPSQLPPAALEALTRREREVVSLVALGLNNHEIADELVISPGTARTHVSRAMIKAGTRDRAQLVVVAYQSGLVRPDA